MKINCDGSCAYQPTKFEDIRKHLLKMLHDRPDLSEAQFVKMMAEKLNVRESRIKEYLHGKP